MKNKEKIKLYILSLAILFLIIMIMSLKMPVYKFSVCSDEPCTVGFWAMELLYAIWDTYKLNWLPCLMFFCFCFSMLIKHQFTYMLQGGGENTIRVCEVKSEDYEHLTFLATYIIPFFGFSFDDPRKLVAYLILLIVIGFIFVRTDKYYANPTLALFGFKLYRANLTDQNGLYESVIVISQDTITPNQIIKYKLISDNVFYAKKK
ncbi:anti-phage protein KwaA [Vibrio anguillarum]|uniref:anti-phage protein KwaA n=1 Tax=Vibrio anguillarum TaxID=55601 RepID=UPI0002D3A11F|nr:anti-phage protein KwaA [Vibrio anguillarum]OEE39967.1 hypothetical protein A1QU_07445 [Vibrio anguillarum]